MERVSARARSRGVGVIDGEALLLDGVNEVDGGAAQVWGAHAVGDDTDATEVLDYVAVETAVIEEQLVAQARASTRLHCDAQRQIIAALGLEKSLHLARSLIGQDDAVGRLGGVAAHDVTHVFILFDLAFGGALVNIYVNRPRGLAIPTIA